jgi:hypothetical protein
MITVCDVKSRLLPQAEGWLRAEEGSARWSRSNT